MNYSFPKHQKLTGKKNIETLLYNGEAFFVHPFRVIYNLQKIEGPYTGAKVIISIPKRKFKLATARNKIKRMLREAIRLQQHNLQAELMSKQLAMHYMLIYQVSETPNFQNILHCTQKIFSKLQKMIEKHA